MNLSMMREAQRYVLEQNSKKNDNAERELLNEFMDWLQTNEHVNKSKEYRRELCEMFLSTRESEST